MAFQSFQARRRSSRLEGSSKSSASSLIRMPNSALVQSKRLKNPSMRSEADIEELRKEEMRVRNSASLGWLL